MVGSGIEISMPTLRQSLKIQERQMAFGYGDGKITGSNDGAVIFPSLFGYHLTVNLTFVMFELGSKILEIFVCLTVCARITQNLPDGFW